MKKFFALMAVMFFVASCSTESTSEEDGLYDNQIESVDGKKIKRPGNGG
jgi:hypothetical protein